MEKVANRVDPGKNLRQNPKRITLDVDYHIGKYDEVISSLTNELENLRHELAVKTHNQHLLLEPQENQGSLVNRIDKANKDLTNHFQEEIRLKKEIIEAEKALDNLNISLKEKEYEMFQLNSQQGVLLVGLRQKEIKTATNKIRAQIQSQNNLIDSKTLAFNDLTAKREVLEAMISKFSKEQLGSSLFYLYQNYLLTVNNLTSEHVRNTNFNLLRQKEAKVNKLIDQIKIRDEYIANAKKELDRKKIKYESKEGKGIKELDELNIDRSFILPKMVYQNNNPKNSNELRVSTDQGTSNLRLPEVNKGGVNNSNALNISKNSGRGNSTPRGYDYQAYSNPNIVKEKKKFKSKTTEIIEKSKKNELTQLRLHMINDLYKNSKVQYLNKQYLSVLSPNELNNVIAFDARLIGRSHSPVRDKVNTSMTSNKSSEISNRSFYNPKEREVDHKVRKILMNKRKRGPYTVK